MGADTPLTMGVLDARSRALEYGAAPGSAARQARRDASDVEHWEARRRGRYVRLWAARLDVWAAARDARDAAYRLVRHVRQPHHRIGDVPILRSTGSPRLCATADVGGGGILTTYPRGALDHRYDRAPFGALERAHVVAYVRALAAARDRLLGVMPCASASRCTDGHEALSRPEGSPLQVWRVSHRILYLAGPGEARARAAELAATVVDDSGAPAAEIVDMRADDGYVDGEGRWVHPALTLVPRAVSALWADYDAAEADVGQPSAIAEVISRAAVYVWGTFARGCDRCSGERNATR
ncbi:hypothetical protein [Saccharomonospora viridis]|uniref:hypothetical protein n=1 Tax=Saccharomonospora viridis TaxID=1852 RepID=UPI0023F3CD6C|nr:hypothetical protein [Saccharomonospora viridis]